MEQSVIIGSTGVSLLLVGFFLNTFGLIRQDSKAYAAVNLVGAGMSCYASILIGFLPFVVLEGAWAAVAAAGLFRARKPW